MKITDIRTFLMLAGGPETDVVSAASEWSTRNWLFVKVYTDEGVVKGEAFGRAVSRESKSKSGGVVWNC